MNRRGRRVKPTTAQLSDSNFKQPHRHCERSEAIHLAAQRKNGLLRFARNDVGARESAIPRREVRPSRCKNIVPRKKRGRREDRVPNAPAASRAKVESTRVSHYRFTGKQPGLPCAMVYGL